MNRRGFLFAALAAPVAAALPKPALAKTMAELSAGQAIVLRSVGIRWVHTMDATPRPHHVGFDPAVRLAT